MKLGLISLLFLSISSVQAQGKSSEFDLFNSKTDVKNPLELRDPFKRTINKKRRTQTKMESFTTGIYSNIDSNLAGATVDNIKVVGVVIGAERRAMIRISSNQPLGQGVNPADGGNVIFVKEGMRIGNEEAEIKAIMPGGIVLVEKIKNVYDQDEYLETVIPLSEE